MGLNHTSLLLKFLKNPQDNFKTIHVAGTNGKGSTAAIINSILIANGYKVGLYTSPHLINFNETNIVFTVSCSKGTYIRVLGKEIAEKLGTVGHLDSLIRTRVGKYVIRDSVSLDQFKLSWKSYTH